MSLPNDLDDFVKEQTSRGGYRSQSDVVRDGLRLLRKRTQKTEVLRRLLAEGQADIDAGRIRPLTDELLHAVAERARLRTRSKRRTLERA
ncbi:MAG TPA: type II toxin-antitoxin system ParD family antitoxin [Candidatus Elarobacter sp.]|nr:type II toxin-antitoxin system ParD family antitoxin [Candidatus Elarobacter sp.]